MNGLSAEERVRLDRGGGIAGNICWGLVPLDEMEAKTGEQLLLLRSRLEAYRDPLYSKQRLRYKSTKESIAARSVSANEEIAQVLDTECRAAQVAGEDNVGRPPPLKVTHMRALPSKKQRRARRRERRSAQRAAAAAAKAAAVAAVAAAAEAPDKRAKVEVNEPGPQRTISVCVGQGDWDGSCTFTGVNNSFPHKEMYRLQLRAMLCYMHQARHWAFTHTKVLYG